MAAIEAWFQDGPVDGRLMAVETNAYARLPEVVKLPQVGVYVGASDVPAPAPDHLYVRVDGPDGEVIYQYVRSVEAL